MLRNLMCLSFLISTSVAINPANVAGQVADLLPASTRFCLHADDYQNARGLFDKTQWGRLVADPLMRPFLDDVQAVMRERMEDAGAHVTLTLDDIDKIAAGEVGYAILHLPQQDGTLDFATVWIVDVTGKEQAVEQVVQAQQRSMAKDKAQQFTRVTNGITMEVWGFPRRPGQDRSDYVVIAQHQNRLYVVSDYYAAADILNRIANPGKDSLSTVAAYTNAMKRSQDAAAGMKPDASWFIEPFGLSEIWRVINPPPKDEQTTMEMLAGEGFNAVQGLGGYLHFQPNPGHDLLIRGLAYAPAIQRPAGDKNKGKYDRSMRMMKFANSGTLIPPALVPDVVSNNLTFNWDLKNAFKYIGTLIDAYVGEPNFYRDVVEALREDPEGPKIDVDKEFAPFLGDHVSMMTDFAAPVDHLSERRLMAFQVTDPKAIAAALKKLFENDATVKRHAIDTGDAWEILEPQNAKNVPPAERGLPPSAMTVFDSYLLVASHVDYLTDVIKAAKANKPLAKAQEFQQIDAELPKIGAGNDSFRFFTRTEKTWRVNYESIKTGKLRDANTMLARMMRGFLGDDNSRRSGRRVNGALLPDFTRVAPYLKNGGGWARTDSTSLYFQGLLLP